MAGRGDIWRYLSKGIQQEVTLFETILGKLKLVTVSSRSLKLTMTLRNSIHRRNHKERSQLAHRSKLGILEKHADYVKRARDYHSKQNRLTRLKQKAAERNKDEFYFSMKNERTKASSTITRNSSIIVIIL